MLIVQPVYSEGVLSPEEIAVPAADTTVRRIYGENVASEIYGDLHSPEYEALVAEFTGNGSRYIFDARSATIGVNYLSRLYLIQKLESL